MLASAIACRRNIAYRRSGAKPHDPTAGRCQKAQFTIKPICERNCLRSGARARAVVSDHK